MMTRTRTLSAGLTLVAVLFVAPAGARANVAPAGARANVAPAGARHAAGGLRSLRVRTDTGSPGFTVQMFRATNASRRNHGLRRLWLNWKLSAIARHHALAMARAHRLYHTSRVGEYLNGVGRWTCWGENIGWTTGGVDLLERAFMASWIHREHILSHGFHGLAVGAVRVHGKLWVSLFFYG